MKEELKLIHGKECIKCKRLFNCPGRKKDTNCVFFEERKDSKKQVIECVKDGLSHTVKS